MYKYYVLSRYDVYLRIFTVLILSLTFSLSLANVSHAESEITCINCVQIPSYEIDHYKEMFPLTVWTDSKVYDHYSIIHVNGYLKPENNVAPILVVVTNPVGNIVTVQQISTDTNGNFSFELNTESPLWKQNGDYVLKVQSGAETRQFKTKFTLVSSLSGSIDRCTSEEISVLANNGHIYCIPYTITQGIVTDANGKLNSDKKTMTLDISGNEVDSITIDIPRYVLDSKSSSGEDSVFLVMSNGKIVEYQELQSNSDSRQIKLDYPSTRNVTIDIVGTHVIPEFGSVAILILIGSIMSILIISKSFSNRLVKF
jgi:predicted secreted protein with PEFG-CTERM motif